MDRTKKKEIKIILSEAMFKLTAMRYLFVLLVLALVGCAKPYGGDCDDIDGLRVTNFDAVPDDYTGAAYFCNYGKVKVLANYKDGKFEGDIRAWHENGELSWESNYKNGKLEGVESEWYGNGQLYYKINHKDGKIIDDKVIYFDSEGSIYKTVYYNNGKRIRCEGDCGFENEEEVQY